MKNTKITFYWTHKQQGDFEKIIFETIVEGTPFNNIQDVNDWDNDNTNYIFNKFGLELVFDHVIMDYKETDEDVKDVEIVKSIIGKLSFKEKKEKLQKNTILVDKDELNKLLNNIKELKEKLTVSELQSLDLQIEKIVLETDLIKKEIEDLKKSKTKPEKKSYPSCWIDSTGTVYTVGFACHNEFAHEWLEENITDYKMSSKYPYEELEELGWCRILGWSDPPGFVIPKKIGPKLKTAIKDYCHNNGVNYPDEIKEKI